MYWCLNININVNIKFKFKFKFNEIGVILYRNFRSLKYSGLFKFVVVYSSSLRPLAVVNSTVTSTLNTQYIVYCTYIAMLHD